jgi:hypothetical protein
MHTAVSAGHNVFDHCVHYILCALTAHDRRSVMLLVLVLYNRIGPWRFVVYVA